MIAKPTTQQLIDAVCTELGAKVAPAVTDPTAKLVLDMAMAVLKGVGVRSANELAWMREESDAIEAVARRFVAELPDAHQLGEALQAYLDLKSDSRFSPGPRRSTSPPARCCRARWRLRTRTETPIGKRRCAPCLISGWPTSSRSSVSTSASGGARSPRRQPRKTCSLAWFRQRGRSSRAPASHPQSSGPAGSGSSRAGRTGPRSVATGEQDDGHVHLRAGLRCVEHEPRHGPSDAFAGGRTGTTALEELLEDADGLGFAHLLTWRMNDRASSPCHRLRTELSVRSVLTTSSLRHCRVGTAAFGRVRRKVTTYRSASSVRASTTSIEIRHRSGVLSPRPLRSPATVRGMSLEGKSAIVTGGAVGLVEARRGAGRCGATGDRLRHPAGRRRHGRRLRSGGRGRRGRGRRRVESRRRATGRRRRTATPGPSTCS